MADVSTTGEIAAVPSLVAQTNAVDTSFLAYALLHRRQVSTRSPHMRQSAVHQARLSKHVPSRLDYATNWCGQRVTAHLGEQSMPPTRCLFMPRARFATPPQNRRASVPITLWETATRDQPKTSATDEGKRTTRNAASTTRQPSKKLCKAPRLALSIRDDQERLETRAQTDNWAHHAGPPLKTHGLPKNLQKSLNTSTKILTLSAFD